MSNVTNVILSFGILENEADRIKEVNKAKCLEGQPFLGADLPPEAYGGYKALETPLYIAALNHVSWQELIAHLKAGVSWEYPEEVQLLVKGQDDDLFFVVNLKDH